MCNSCDYPGLLEGSGLDLTPRRAAVLEAIGDSPCPVSAQEILEKLSPARNVNRVTVYRILDLFVKKRLVERISSGDRSFRYGLAPNANHRPHPHFFCTSCGRMECLDPEAGGLRLELMARSFPGRIEKIEVRLDGTCRDCLEGRGE